VHFIAAIFTNLTINLRVYVEIVCIGFQLNW